MLNTLYMTLTASPTGAVPVLLIGLANALLDPEQLGHAVTAEVRDMARLALGKPAVESHLKPLAVTDWSAA